MAQELLMQGVLDNRPAQIRLAIQGGADVAAAGRGGIGALHLAAHRGHVAAIECVLGFGAELDAQEDVRGFTPLMSAVASGELEAVRALIAGGANIDRAGLKGYTALGLAAVKGRHAIARLLLENGANVDQREAGGITPLFGAVHEDDAAMVELLLGFGADAGARADNGVTPRDLARQGGHEAALKALG